MALLIKWAFVPGSVRGEVGVSYRGETGEMHPSSRVVDDEQDTVDRTTIPGWNTRRVHL